MSDVCLTLSFPAALRESVVDTLLTVPHGDLFTSTDAAAHGLPPARLSAREQVLGSATLTQVQAILAQEDQATVLDIPAPFLPWRRTALLDHASAGQGRMLMKSAIVFSLMLAWGAARAAPPAAPGLLPTALVRAMLDQDPEVAAARAGYAAAREDAGILDASPYEWTANVVAQRRTVEAGPVSREWNAGVERTLRLPGKARADRRIGQATLEEGAARYGLALHETARALLAMWLAWAHAEESAVLAERQLAIATDNLGQRRQACQGGRRRRLDAGLARSELAELRRASIDAGTASAVAWARLHARFPGLTRAHAALPGVIPLAADGAYWRTRVLGQSDEIRIAGALHGKAQAQTDRARADRVPDPTIGLFTASEAGGRERLTGIALTIPIPGSQRARRLDREVFAADMARFQAERTRRAVEAAIAAAVASAQGSYASWQAARTAAQEMADNGTSMQRAYQLGEAELPALLMARRQATTAAQAALDAQLAAAQAYYGLLVDGHLVWEMEHD